MTTEVSSERRTVKAKEAVRFARCDETDAEVATYKFNADSVRPLQAIARLSAAQKMNVGRVLRRAGLVLRPAV